MTMVNKKLRRKASCAVTWSVIATQILSPVTFTLIPANSFASSANTESAQTNANDEYANELASLAANAGQSLANNTAGRFAVDTLSAQATKEVVDWLQQYGNARIKLNVDESFTLKDAAFDFLYPWMDSKDYVLFSQTSLHRTDDRNQANIGLGLRHFTTDNAMLGANIFYDYDLSRHHSRAGLGVEYWRDYMRFGANTYFGLSDWKDSRDIDDYLERPANGWDVSAEGWLPVYPQLGASLQFEKYYGKNVGLFGSDNLQENPYAVTGEISYTPVPLVKLSAQHKQGQSNNHDTRFGVEINYRPGVPLAKQLDSENVAVMREVQNRRYDFVERNNNIVLEYKKKSALRIRLPDAIEGQGGTTLPVTLNVSNASSGIESVQWSDSAFVAAGGKITGSGTSWQFTLPAYQYGGVNSWTVGATARDHKGHVSNYAVMNISVISSEVSVNDSSFTLNGSNNAQIVADGQSNYPVVLSLKDAKGQPLTGLAKDIQMSLEFTANNAQRSRNLTEPQLSEVQEVSAGVYRAVLTAGSQEGTVRVTAKVLNKSFTLTVKQTAKTESEAEPDTGLTVAPAQQVVGYNINLQMAAKDAEGKPITGDKSLHFYAINGTNDVQFGAVTEKDGVYSSTVTTKRAGKIRIGVKSDRHSFSGVEKEISFIEDRTQPVFSRFEAVQNNALADGKQQNKVKVQLTDPTGNAIPDYAVTLSLPSGVTQVGGEHAVSTDANGNATFALVSSTPGSYVVKAQAGNQVSPELTLTFASNMAGASLTLTPENSSAVTNIPANGKSAAVLNVQLTNSNNTSVNGQKIELITSSADLSIPANIITDGTGRVSVPITTVKAGEYTVKARVTDGSHRIESDVVKVTFVPDLATAKFTMEVSKPQIVADGKESSAVNIQLVDANNNIFAGNVALSVSPSSGASLASKLLQLDASGRAKTQFTAAKAGQYTIEAAYEQNGTRITSSQRIDAVTDARNAVLTISPSASSVVVSDTDNLTFTLSLKSESGEALSNRVLSIKTTGPSDKGALVVDHTSVTTGSDGKATVNVHGRTAGAYKMIVAMDELGSNTSAEQSFSLYADADNGVLTVNSDFGYVTDDGEPFGFIARLTDSFGNPLSGVAEFTAGSEDHPDSGNITMTPAKAKLTWTGHASSELRTYVAGVVWVKVVVDTGKKKYEKTETTYVSKLPKPDEK
ncbi:inverse autotransporter beta domain-containing protein [Escherichia albertii]|uniref:Attachment protein n=1 Tax=Escherichia albertii TaxID=208962 RepID=A0ABX5HP11_ESCAL|nr:inverse autotransporter beta domain-containing protein [Escherichia albertii]MCZ8968674.1 inverse autotransporter beta domain-containing protein [Escherichia albertii]PSY45054.1 attachment protein [Escherichia albertii]WDB94937.1 inverse autotransporter beta domain-containing protein [Escherichia albertii]